MQLTDSPLFPVTTLFRRLRAPRPAQPALYAVRGSQGGQTLCSTLEEAEHALRRRKDAMLFDADGACLYR